MKKEEKSVQTKAKPKVMSCAHGVGRRKSSVARVWLKKGSGKVLVNNRELKDYFSTDMTRLDALTPFQVCSSVSGLYDVKVRILGGGMCSQAGAMRLGLARAILCIDPELRPSLKKNKLLSVDSRLKERKKYGQRGARRKFQFVKR